MHLPHARDGRTGNRGDGLGRILRRLPPGTGFLASARRNLKGNPTLSNHNLEPLAMHHPALVCGAVWPSFGNVTR